MVAISRDNVLRYIFTNEKDFYTPTISWSDLKIFYTIFNEEITKYSIKNSYYKYTHYFYDEDLDPNRFLDFGDYIYCIKFDMSYQDKIEKKYYNDPIIINALRKAKKEVIKINNWME